MILLDTHVLLWKLADQRRLSRRARAVIEGERELYISPITCWEVATLVVKGRIALDRDVHVWVRDLFATEHIRPAALTPEVATAAGLLGRRGFHADPADRIIYATATHLGAAVVTKDQRIRTFARDHHDVAVIW